MKILKLKGKKKEKKKMRAMKRAKKRSIPLRLELQTFGSLDLVMVPPLPYQRKDKTQNLKKEKEKKK